MKRVDWLILAHHAVKKYETPFYLFSTAPIRQQLDRFSHSAAHGASNWLSLKTLPLRPLLSWWLSTGLGVEVTSEYELLAALQEGVPSNFVMVNGVAKHSWNKGCWTEGLRVNFDSLTEIDILAPIASRYNWGIGLRFHPSVQKNPDNPDYQDQFGISQDALAQAFHLLNKYQLKLETIHVHLRSQVPNSDYFKLAIEEIDESICRQFGIKFKCLDLGGGLPAEGIKQLDKAWTSNYKLHDIPALMNFCQAKFPFLQEIIYENGRFLLSKCGLLILTVRDIKIIGGQRYLICDGGRTNHALPSDWEAHEICVLQKRSGNPVDSIVCGPTCMAYDNLGIVPLPNDTQIGDNIIWFNAGAYSLSWENRFSHPLACVLWHDDRDNNIIEVRSKESFNEWWGRWSHYETHSS